MIRTGRMPRGSRIGLALAVVAMAACTLQPGPLLRRTCRSPRPRSLYPAFDPGVSDYVVRCTPGTPVQVTISAPVGTDVDVDGHGAAPGDFSTAVGLESGQALRSCASAAGHDLYYVRCLPSDFPSWTYQRSGQPQAEWYLVDTLNGARYGMAFDRDGVPVWWLGPGAAALDFRLLPNGDVMFARTWARGRSGVPAGRHARPCRPGGPPATDPHEVQLLPNGDYLVAAAAKRPRTARVRASGLTCSDTECRKSGPTARWFGPGGRWITSRSRRSRPLGVQTALAGAPEDPKDVYHINAIEPTADGFMKSPTATSTPSTPSTRRRSVSWKIGGVHRPESLTVLDDPLSTGGGDTFRGQHDVRLMDDGTVTVHDNGFHPAGDTRPPRAVRFAIDTAAGTATLVEQKDDPGAIGTPLCCGSARKLPGGDWVINWGSSNLMTGARSARRPHLEPQPHRIVQLPRAAPAPGHREQGRFPRGQMLQYPRGYPRPKGPASSGSNSCRHTTSAPRLTRRTRIPWRSAP